MVYGPIVSYIGLIFTMLASGQVLYGGLWPVISLIITNFIIMDKNQFVDIFSSQEGWHGWPVCTVQYGHYQ